MNKLIQLLEKSERVYIALMVCSSILLSLTGVFYRYVLNSSLAFVEELSGLMLAGIIIIGTSLAITTREHIRVEVIPQVFPITKTWLNSLAWLAMFGVSVLMFVLTTKFVHKLIVTNQTTSSIESLPVGWPLVIVPAGYLLCSVKSVWLLWNEITGKSSPNAGDLSAVDALSRPGSTK